MRIVVIGLLLVGALPVSAQSEAEAVEQLARDALAAISDRDSTAFMALMAPGAKAYSVFGGSLRARDVTDDARGLAAETRVLLERMWDPVVHVDGDLAVVWTKYDFWIDGSRSHCGTDAFQMINTGDGWRIVSIAYNGRRDCEPSPLGDPDF